MEFIKTWVASHEAPLFKVLGLTPLAGQSPKSGGSPTIGQPLENILSMLV